MVAVALATIFGAMRLAIQLPTMTPKALVVIKASADPANTIHGDWDSALISKVESWVLSPNSARNMVMKVELKTDIADGLLSGCSFRLF